MHMHAIQHRSLFLPTPTTEVDIVTIVVPVVVLTLAVVVAIPATVAFIALLCRKWRKKTTAPVGGTQDQGV